jgi:Bifunctional DNA primase/polymerase, N-terminal
VTLAAAAIDYARRGWAVFPVLPRGKRPITEHGLNDASTDPGLVAAWWEQRPQANIGVNCGRSGLLVVDLDGGQAVRAWVELAGGKGGQPTLAAGTGGGIHLYFVGDGPSSAGRVAPHIDTRGAGGYVIAPPSVHPSRATYRWLDAAVAPSPAPSWLLEALDHGLLAGEIGERRELPPGMAFSAYGRAALHALVREMENTPEGERNDTLNALAYRCGRLTGAGQLAAGVARSMLVAAAVSVGLEAKEADRTFRSGFATGLLRPLNLEGHAEPLRKPRSEQLRPPRSEQL